MHFQNLIHRQIHFVTVCSNLAKVQYLIQSAKQFDIKLTILLSNNWIGFESKIFGILEHIQSIPEDELICFIDAYDVLFTSDTDSILSTFLNLNCDILFSSELICYPNNNLESYNKIYKNCKCLTNYIYLNSGGFIGYKKDVMKMLTWKTREEISNICKVGGDQNYFTQYFFYIKSYSSRIILDIEQKLFQSMCALDYFETFEVLNTTNNNKRIHNKVLNQFPSIIHFNGFGDMEIKKAINKNTGKLENIIYVFIVLISSRLPINSNIPYKYPFEIISQNNNY